MADTSEKLVSAELLGRPKGELEALLTDRREQWRKAAFKHASRELSTTHHLRQLRRDVARLQTALVAKKQQEVAEG